MISIRKAAERPKTTDGARVARHSFAVTGCEQPSGKGLSCLIALNEETLEPGQGTPMHGHEHIEVLTYVLDGVLAYTDSLGNQVRMLAGEVQVLSAGAGASHSERNGSQVESLKLIHAWFHSDSLDPEPRWEQTYYSDDRKKNALCLIASRDGRDNSLTIRQDVLAYASVLRAGNDLYHRAPAGRTGYLHVALGALTLNGEALAEGDGAIVADEEMHLESEEGAEVLIFDLPEAQAPD